MSTDLWNERYRGEGYIFGTAPNDFLASVAGEIPSGRVLCLAEGEGRNAVYLAELGHEVVAVDASSVGMAKAERLAAERGVCVRTVVADLADFDMETASWDAVVSIFCHVAPEVRKALHRRVQTGLRPGGVFILEGYTPEQLEFNTGGPPAKEKLMTLAMLTRELEGLELTHARETHRDVIEGTLHTGNAAVVQVVARKPR